MDPITAVTLFVTWYPVAVAVSAAICAATPTPKDDKVFGKVRKILDIVAFNIGHAKNR